MTASDQPVRIALAGAGAIGRRHIGYLKSDARFDLVGAADPAPSGAATAREFGLPHFADFRAMLDALSPEGVIVATPNQTHEDVAVACLERGVPVLIEKPVAHSLESARRIVAAVERTGVAALVGHHRRHNPLMRAAREFLAAGGIGRMVAVAATDLRRKPDAYFNVGWRREPGGGPLLINGIHDIDCLRALCGEVDSVMAVTSSGVRGFAVEDTAVVTFTFANGALGTLTLSDAVQAPWAWEVSSGEEPEYPHAPADTYLICGTEGALAVPTLTHWKNERGGGRADPFITKRLFFVPADPWLEELRHFAEIIRGRAQPLVTVADGTRTLATTLAIGVAAARRAPVTIDELYR